MRMEKDNIMLMARAPRALVRQIRIYCIENDMTMQAFVTAALNRELQHREKKSRSGLRSVKKEVS